MRAVKHHIGIAVILLIFLVVSLPYLKIESNRTRAHEVSLVRGRTHHASGNLQFDRNRDFYRVIVENNLFRPLGWRPPKRQPEYTLVATWIESGGGTAKTLLVEQRSKKPIMRL